MSKQTAVEWLVNELNNRNWNIDFYKSDIKSLIEQAKAMEEEQMIKFAFDFYYKHSKKMGVPFNLISENRINAEQYYNETYGGDK
jgi:hypothetical protein